MKKALLLFAALLVAGCGEKSSSEGSESASENPTPSNESAEPSVDTAKPPPAKTPVAESPSESPTPPSEDVKPSADSPEPLISDADVERFAKDAMDSLAGGSPPEDYTGWTKAFYGGRLRELMQWKNGKPDGPSTMWHENGQKSLETTNKDGKEHGIATQWHENGQKWDEVTYKDGKLNGRATAWHKNGQKMKEGTYKDGKELSAKYWNSKGEEVATLEESKK